MTIEEFETIRLIDLAGASQAECARSMDIARTTVQSIYSCARHKLAAALVNGCTLLIEGGDYRLCSAHAPERSCCWQKHCPRIYAGQKIERTDNKMKIAIPYDNEQVFQHFGKAAAFKIYTADAGKISSHDVISTNGSGHGALVGFLQEQGVDTVICGGIGFGAQEGLAAAGIKVCAGASGSCDDAINGLLAGTFTGNPNATCDHHGHGSSCGQHHCGQH
jgi:predicted Fe-Mo cluster-binding NifX family protein